MLDAIALLTATRVPGVYVQVDKAFVFAFDAVDVRVKERMPGRLVLSLRNPTDADARVRIVAETAAEAERPLAPGAPLPEVAVPRAAVEVVDVAARAGCGAGDTLAGRPTPASGMVRSLTVALGATLLDISRCSRAGRKGWTTGRRSTRRRWTARWPSGWAGFDAG